MLTGDSESGDAGDDAAPARTRPGVREGSARTPGYTPASTEQTARPARRPAARPVRSKGALIGFAVTPVQ